MLTKLQIAAVDHFTQMIRTACAGLDSLTDAVVEKDCARGTDDMQSAYWQNVYRMQQTVVIAVDEFAPENIQNSYLL